ncbi:hypothetical protein LCGC14_1589230 [marine sediment metagenome]|uniref:Uncharacterized protein n=1 Tax=marine sediment metagenome TaxID=412755 RepID=A0A0F9KVB5_9ZZZZ
MATRFEYYIFGDTHFRNLYPATWQCQTFTPTATHNLTSAIIKLYRYLGVPEGNVEVRIRATEDGKPTGPDLASSSRVASSLTTGTAGAWYTFTLSVAVRLEAGQTYAIIAYAPEARSDAQVRMKYDAIGAEYSGGEGGTSTNSGDTWSMASGGDFLFEEWGNQLVSKTLQVKWNVLAITQVSDTLQVKWNVLTSAAKSIEYRWGVLALVSQSAQLIFSVRALTGDSLQVVFNILTPVSHSVQFVFNILTPVNKAVRFVFNVSGITKYVELHLRRRKSLSLTLKWR